jgi:hypothetical protein
MLFDAIVRAASGRTLAAEPPALLVHSYFEAPLMLGLREIVRRGQRTDAATKNGYLDFVRGAHEAAPWSRSRLALARPRCEPLGIPCASTTRSKK